MGLSKLKEIVNSLLKTGWSSQMPVLVISRGTRMDEQIVEGNLENIEAKVFEAQLQPPALIIAGPTAQLHKRQPIKNWLHCGTHPDLYRSFGHIIPFPMIAIQPVILSVQEREVLNGDFNKADLVVLTSPTAAEHFMHTILEIKPLQEIKHKIFAVIGKHTGGTLEEFGVTPQIMSPEETAQGFFKTLAAIMHLRGKNILLPRSSLPNPFLKESLETQGAVVKEWTIYNNIKPPRRNFPAGNIDGVIFTSPSTVKNFLEDYQSIPKQWAIIAKGPVTEAALKEAGYHAANIS